MHQRITRKEPGQRSAIYTTLGGGRVVMSMKFGGRSRTDRNYFVVPPRGVVRAQDPHEQG